MSKKSRSRLWFLVHSWLALPIWFFLLIICVTGTLATVSQEIVWLANPDVRASKPSTDAERLDYEHILQAVQTQEPRLAVLGLSRPQEDHFALTVRVAYPDATTATLYVNPYSGAIQGTSPLFDFRQFTLAGGGLGLSDRCEHQWAGHQQAGKQGSANRQGQSGRVGCGQVRHSGSSS